MQVITPETCLKKIYKKLPSYFKTQNVKRLHPTFYTLIIKVSGRFCLIHVNSFVEDGV